MAASPTAKPTAPPTVGPPSTAEPAISIPAETPPTVGPPSTAAPATRPTATAPTAAAPAALPAGGPPRIDWPAQLTAAAVLALATDTLIAAGAAQWLHTAAAAIATVMALSLFVALERRSAAPVLNRMLLRAHGVGSALLAGATIAFVLSGVLFVLPLYLRHAHHLTALRTGLALLPLTIPFAVNPPLTGRIVARVGPHRPIGAGLALLALGTGGLAYTAHTGAGYGWLVPSLLVVGLGISFALPALAVAVVSAAPAGAQGAASGVLHAVRQVGATVGVAVMGAALAAGAGWSLSGAAALSLLSLTVFSRSARRRRR